jgi:small subunit ribosomal protein S9
MTTAIKQEKTKEEEIKFKGRFISATGKRKSATALTRLYEKGTGKIMVNGQEANDYFPANLIPVINQPLKLSGRVNDYNFSIIIKGGGKSGQAEAARHGISQALLKLDKELRLALRTKDMLTRDSRKKERKKPGLKRARRAPQWAKR